MLSGTIVGYFVGGYGKVRAILPKLLHVAGGRDDFAQELV